MLIILGDGVVANVTLNKSGMKGAGSIQITIAWGLAVMLPAFIFGAASGAHFNPALTLALAASGHLYWSLVPGYIIAQFAGAFVGAVIVWIAFKDQFDATDDYNVPIDVDINFDPYPILWTLENAPIPIRGHQTVPLLKQIPYCGHTPCPSG